METNKESGTPQTPKEGDKVYCLNPIESTLIDFLRVVSIKQAAEDFDCVFQKASFESNYDLDSETKDSLWTIYRFTEILKGRHLKIREQVFNEEPPKQ
jgi:hypothetical protein